MVTRRQRRINELMMQELSMLLPGRVDDPRLATVVVTHVESTQDLSAAKVYFTTAAPADAETMTGINEGLEQARGFLRGELAGLGLRRVPRLVFARDRDYDRQASGR
jgi:ribosome-binding factor A